MKIAHVVSDFVSTNYYSEHYLAINQEKEGENTVIITSDIVRTEGQRYKKRGSFVEGNFKVHRIKTYLNYTGFHLTSIREVDKVLSIFAPDIVHLQGIFNPLSLMIILLKNKYKYKVVADVITGKIVAHGFELFYKLFMLKVCLLLFNNTIHNNIALFFAISKRAREWIISNLKIEPQKIVFVPLCTDTTLFQYNEAKRKEIRSKLNIRQNEFVFIFTGKMLPNKQIDILLYSISLLKKENIEFKLLLLGGAPIDYQQKLLNIIKNEKLREKIIFHPFVSRHELPHYFSAADAAVWPGGPSISIIDAISTSLPVILVESDWTKHILRNTGLSFKPNDIMGLFHCLKTIYYEKDMHNKFRGNCRELAEEQFDCKRISQKYLKLYKLVCGDSIFENK